MVCGRGTPSLWKCFCMLYIFLENYVYTLRDATVEREFKCLWPCNINSFIHSCTHSTNLYGGRGLLPHKTHNEFSTLTSCFDLKQEVLLNVKIPQSMFVSHTNNSNKNNPCHLGHQKKKEIHPCNRSKQVILVTLQTCIGVPMCQAVQQVLGTWSRRRQSLGSRSSQPHEGTDTACMGRMSRNRFKKRRRCWWILKDKENDGQWVLNVSQPQCFQILSEVLLCSVATFSSTFSTQITWVVSQQYIFWIWTEMLSGLNKCFTNSPQEKVLSIVYLSSTNMNLILYWSKEY